MTDAAVAVEAKTETNTETETKLSVMGPVSEEQILDLKDLQIYELSQGAETVVVFSKPQPGRRNLALHSLREAISQTSGWEVASSLGERVDAGVLIANWDHFVAQADRFGYSIPVSLSKFVEERVEARRQQIKASIEAGFIEFGDLGLLFSTGTEIASTMAGEPVGAVVMNTEVSRSWMGTKFVIRGRVISTLAGQLEFGFASLVIPYFAGRAQIKDLPVRPITADEKAALDERGKFFEKYCKAASYLHYDGQIVQMTYWSQRSYRADGRVMVDAPSMAQTASDLLDSCRRKFDVRSEGEGQKDFEITAENRWTSIPYVPGFSFSAKQWGLMKVSGFREIAWRTDAWDKLVLDDDKKELISALVKHHGQSFSDIVDDKGGGVIFMLSGPPGEGKTLTMETIAEFLQKPLYRISVGELGTNPDQLEERLREILDIATTWNAVVGLDEADIFLAKREKNDILRNAMVGVFLRLTEYHQGVLFLTTNLVEQIDEAFESRISVHIEFGKGDINKREKIWNQLLAAAQVPEGTFDVKLLRTHELNGRQIKNAIRQAQTLALNNGRAVSTVEMDRVLATLRRH